MLLYPVTAQLLSTVSGTHPRGQKRLPYTIVIVFWDSDWPNFVIMGFLEFTSVAYLYHSVMDYIKPHTTQGSYFICHFINFILKILHLLSFL